MLSDRESLVNTPFMTRCLKCRANVTNLSLIPVIRHHSEKYSVQSCYEMSTYGATLEYLAANFSSVTTSEYHPGLPPGAIVNGIRNEDVQQLSFAGDCFDVVTSNQVFEHVPDDVQGYAECYRVLKPGGALIFSIPMSRAAMTRQAAEIVNGEIVHHMTPEYHDSRLGGPNTALVFWHHSINDICQRVERAGFKARLEDVTVTPAQLVPQKVIYAVKPS
jgi:SAM-dependent methyltransferase